MLRLTLDIHLQTQACLAGDSAAYERRASNLDDVVIISALRTPMCKVRLAMLLTSLCMGLLSDQYCTAYRQSEEP